MIEKFKQYWRYGFEGLLVIYLILTLSLYLIQNPKKDKQQVIKQNDSDVVQQMKTEISKENVEAKGNENKDSSSREVEYSIITKFLQQSFSTNYQYAADDKKLEGMELILQPTVSKPYQPRKHNCIDKQSEIFANQSAQAIIKQNIVGNKILLWCTSENKIFVVSLLDDRHASAFVLSKDEKPKVLHQKEIYSSGNQTGEATTVRDVNGDGYPDTASIKNDPSTMYVSLIDWKYAPDIDEDWFTFQFSEYSKTGNVMWEPNTFQKYLYYWQTPEELKLREYCVTEEFNKETYPNRIPTLICSHVEKSSRSKFGIK